MDHRNSVALLLVVAGILLVARQTVRPGHVTDTRSCPKGAMRPSQG